MLGWLLVACSALQQPSPREIAADASVDPPVQVGGGASSRVMSTPSRLGAVTWVGDRIVWSVPQALLAVPAHGGPTTVYAQLPEDCWPRELAVAGGAVFAPCGGALLRVTAEVVRAVLEGPVLFGVAAGHGGVYTCRSTRLVRMSADGATYETVADLGVVPHPAGGPSSAACVGAELAVGDAYAYVRHGRYVWAVPREGGAPQELARAARILAFGDRLLRHDRVDGAWAWREGPRTWLATGLEEPCGTVVGSWLVGCRRNEADELELVRVDLGSSGSQPEVLASVSGDGVVGLAAAGSSLAWAEGDAETGGRLRAVDWRDEASSPGVPAAPAR